MCFHETCFYTWKTKFYKGIFESLFIFVYLKNKMKMKILNVTHETKMEKLNLGPKVKLYLLRKYN